MLEHGWESLAQKLAALVPDTADGAVSSALDALSRATVNGVPLDGVLSLHLPGHREVITRGVLSYGYAKEMTQLRAVLEAILEALAPLRKLRLVSVAESKNNLVDEDLTDYALHVHRGPADVFPISVEALPFKLGMGFCYLIAEDPQRRPLLLTPIVASYDCESCQRVVVAVSSQLVLGGKAARVPVRGVTCRHMGTVALPWSKRAQALYTATSDAAKHSRPPGNIIGSPDTLPQPNSGRPSEPKKPTNPPDPPAKIKILLLGANPSDTTRLSLDREFREITEQLSSAPQGGRFEIVHAWALRVRDLHRFLLQHRPPIIHFSGHGRRKGAPAGEGERVRGQLYSAAPGEAGSVQFRTGEIIVENEAGLAVPITAEALAHLFGIVGGVRCVVLNACHTASQAKTILQHVDCLVGMDRAIEDTSAIAFARAFYQALGHGESIQSAFELGRNEIMLENLPGADIPTLRVKEGVNPHTLRLMAGEDR
jgi:hypothetical protein